MFWHIGSYCHGKQQPTASQPGVSSSEFSTVSNRSNRNHECPDIDRCLQPSRREPGSVSPPSSAPPPIPCTRLDGHALRTDAWADTHPTARVWHRDRSEEHT